MIWPHIYQPDRNLVGKVAYHGTKAIFRHCLYITTVTIHTKVFISVY